MFDALLRRFPHWPRWANHVLANVCGYYWMSCPNCGREYGGHERATGRYSCIFTGPGHGIAVCWRCDGCKRAIASEQRINPSLN